MFINSTSKISNMLKLVYLVLLFGLSVTSYAESLFDKDSFEPLAADNKAYKKGDIITILITENAEATTSASTVTNKSSGISGSVNFPIASGQGGFDVDQDFKGGGQIEREGSLLATLTVSVKEVMPNGYLFVQGEQEVTVNNEIQQINIEGKIRPEDIDSSNTILSTRVGDAKISYNGKGIIHEKQTPGIFAKLLTIIGFLL